MIKLSVLICLHNQEELIIKALKSLPVRDDVEVIVCDNGSTDGSLKAAEKYRDEHPELNLTVVSNGREINPAYTGNRMIAMSHGEYFHLHCDDDYVIMPEFGKLIDDYLYSNENYDVVAFDLRENSMYRLPVNESTHTWRSAQTARFIKKTFADGIKLREDKIGQEDKYFNYEMIARNPKMVFTGVMAYHYNYPREGSLTDLFGKGLIKNEMSIPKVSIIVPVWNQEELVIRALDSVPRRDDIEVLVCDDGSDDNTLKNVREYAKAHKDIKIRVLHHKENRGLGFTKNKLYDNAKGEYIYELDSDDYLITDAFNSVIPALDGADIVYVNLVVNSGEILYLNEQTKTVWVGGASKFVRREYLGDIRCEEVRVFEDVVVNKALMAKPHTEKFTGKVVYHYNWPREGSLCWLGSKGLIK